MVVGMSSAGVSFSHGGQEAERQKQEGARDKVPQGLTSSDLLPPASPHPLKFLKPPKIVPPTGAKPPT
jgi:hypothetical protein